MAGGGSPRAAEEYADDLDYWGAPDGDVYLAQNGVAWGTGSSTNMEKIGRESWLAFFNRGLVSWTQIRRLDFPLPVADQASYYPSRYTYPVNEQSLNPTSYDDAAAAMGADTDFSKIFWDMN